MQDRLPLKSGHQECAVRLYVMSSPIKCNWLRLMHVSYCPRFSACYYHHHTETSPSASLVRFYFNFTGCRISSPPCTLHPAPPPVTQLYIGWISWVLFAPASPFLPLAVVYRRHLTFFRNKQRSFIMERSNEIMRGTAPGNWCIFLAVGCTSAKSWQSVNKWS